MSVNTPAISLRGVMKGYRFFRLEDVSLELEQGQIMGLVGPNGAGKSTTIRILMGLVGQEAGEVRLLGHHMPTEQAKAKRDVGYVSDDMRLFGHATLGWHMAFVRSIYPGWDDAYADALLDRFLLHPEQRIKGLSHGERVKALLLLVLARRPRLLVLDEPTTGLDPVARHEVLVELMAALQDEERSILFSSHNTLDVEQISDQITFIDRGRVIQSLDKETFLERWRRIEVDLTGDVCLETLPWRAANRLAPVVPGPPFILVVTMIVLLASYHYLVRPTFIGQLLNGRKYPRGSRGETPRAPDPNTPHGLGSPS